MADNKVTVFTRDTIKLQADREKIPGLSFSETLTPLGNHGTLWVDIHETNWLDFVVKMESTDAVNAVIEYTDAADPNSVAPGADDVVRTLSTQVAGSVLNGTSADVLSFGLPAQLTWARVTVTDLTGGQDIDVACYSHVQPPTGAQIPLNATLTKDFRAPITQAAIRAENEATGDVNTVPANRQGQLKMEIAGIDDSLHYKLLGADAAIFGAAIVGNRVNLVDAQFHTLTDPDDLLRVVTKTGSASSTITSGTAHFNSGTDTDVDYMGVTTRRIHYQTAHEVYGTFTAGWPTPPTSAGDFAQCGLVSDESLAVQDGYLIGYKGTEWGVQHIRGGTEVAFIPQSSFNQDTLDGNPLSRLTRDNVVEAIDLTKINVFRVRFGWLGVAPTLFEVMAPDGQWVLFHVMKHPNSLSSSQVDTPNFNLGMRIIKDTSDATDIEMLSGSWAGGIVSNTQIAQKPSGEYITVQADGIAYDVDGTAVVTYQNPGPGGSYNTGNVDTDGYNTIDLIIRSDQQSQSNGVTIEFLDDPYAAVPQVIDSESFTFGPQDVINGSLHLNIFTGGGGFRIDYNHGGVDSTNFYLCAVLRVEARGPTNTLTSSISSTSQATMGRNALFADDGANGFELIGRDGGGPGINTHVTGIDAEVLLEALSSGQIRRFTLTSSSINIDSTPLPNRKGFIVVADAGNNQDVFINLNSAATTSSLRLEATHSFALPLNETVTIHGRSNSGNQEVFLIEVGT